MQTGKRWCVGDFAAPRHHGSVTLQRQALCRSRGDGNHAGEPVGHGRRNMDASLPRRTPFHDGAVAFQCQTLIGTCRDGLHAGEMRGHAGLAENVATCGDHGAAACEGQGVGKAGGDGNHVGGAIGHRRKAIETASPPGDRAVTFQHQGKDFAGSNGHHTHEPGWHIGLAAAVVAPGHHPAVAIERHGVISTCRDGNHALEIVRHIDVVAPGDGIDLIVRSHGMHRPVEDHQPWRGHRRSLRRLPTHDPAQPQQSKDRAATGYYGTGVDEHRITWCFYHAISKREAPSRVDSPSPCWSLGLWPRGAGSLRRFYRFAAQFCCPAGTSNEPPIRRMEPPFHFMN